MPAVASADSNTPGCFAEVAGADTPIGNPQEVRTGTAISIQLVCGGTPSPLTGYQITAGTTHGSDPQSGSLGNTVTYAPTATAPYLDSFTFTAHDADADVYPLVTVNLSVVQDVAPVCSSSNSATVRHGASIVVPFSCSDIEGDPFSVAIVQAPTQGTASISGPSIAYTANASAATTDSVRIRATEIGSPSIRSADATITFTITNATPICTAASATTNENAAVSFSLSCTDPDGDPLRFGLVHPARHGSVSIDGATAAYTPVAGYAGVDVLTFEASDGMAASGETVATITILGTPPIVTPPSAPPSAPPALVVPPSAPSSPLLNPRINAPASITGRLVTVSLKCPAAMTEGCAGRVHLSVVVNGHARSLGTRNVTLGIGKNGRFRIVAPGAARRALIRALGGTTVNVKVVFTTRSATGAKLIVTKTVKLRVPRH